MTTGIDPRPRRPLNLVVAAVYGAIIALMLGYASSYVLTRFGWGVIAGPMDWRGHFPELLSRAGLNYYAMHHISLFGTESLSAHAGSYALYTFPLTVWVFVPTLALLIGGYVSARTKASAGRWGMVGAGVASGIVYALILAVISPHLRATMAAFVMPEIGGISSNPPQYPFRPCTVSTLAFAGSLGIAFGYLGSMLAVRANGRRSARGKWWACGKAVVVMTIIVQILICGAVAAWSVAKSRAEAASGGQRPRILEMLPSAAGIGSALIYGATLVGDVESRSVVEKAIQHPFQARVNLYRGIESREGVKVTQKPLGWPVRAAALVLGCLSALIAGGLAVRWGSRDGSLPTAFRVTLALFAYIAAMMAISGMELIQHEPLMVLSIVIKPLYSSAMLLWVFGVFALSLLGAHVAGRMRVGVL